MKVKLTEWPHGPGYRGSSPGARGLWRVGEVREVPSETASYLMETYPTRFEAEKKKRTRKPKPEEG